MAPFAFDLLDEEQQKKQNQQDQGGGAPEMTGGGESFGSGGGAGGPKPQAGSPAGTSKQGSGFVNLDKYMSANQGNNFGGQFTGKVQGDVSSAKEGLSKNANDFTQASNQGTTRWNDVGDQVKGIVDNAGAGTSADDVANFKKYAGATYQGPESFTGSTYGNKAQGSVTKASQEAGALQSEGGRFALLDQFYGRPNYSMGQKSLDNLLVQKDPGVAARSNAINNQAKQIATDSGQTSQQMDNLAIANKQATQDESSQAQNYLGSANTALGDQINSELAAKKQSNSDAYQQMLRRLNDNSLADEDYSALGAGTDMNIYNLDPSRYLTQSEAPTAYNTATAQEYARAKALAGLSGQDDSALLPSTYAPQAATAPAGYQFDTAALRNDAMAQENAFNQSGRDFETGISPYFSVAPGSITGDPRKDAQWLQDNKNLIHNPATFAALEKYVSDIKKFDPDRKLGGDTGHMPLGGFRNRAGG